MLTPALEREVRRIVASWLPLRVDHRPWLRRRLLVGLYDPELGWRWGGERWSWPWTPPGRA